MAPSLHLRPTWGKTRTPGSSFTPVSAGTPVSSGTSVSAGTSVRSVTALAGAVLLGATLALSGCSSQEAQSAAIVDGSTISDKEVQGVALQINALPQVQQKLAPSTVLFSLILAPYVLAEASRTGKGVTDGQARQAIAKVVNPSRQTVDFVRMQLAFPSLNVASQAAILNKISKATITVNPRYGTFDPKQGLIPTSPNWIKAAAKPVTPEGAGTSTAPASP